MWDKIFNLKCVINYLYDLRQGTVSLGQFSHLYFKKLGLDLWFSNKRSYGTLALYLCDWSFGTFKWANGLTFSNSQKWRYWLEIFFSKFKILYPQFFLKYFFAFYGQLELQMKTHSKWLHIWNIWKQLFPPLQFWRCYVLMVVILYCTYIVLFPLRKTLQFIWH